MEPKRKPTGLPKKEPEADKPKKRTAGAATAVPISRNKKTAPTPEQLETRVTAKETVQEQDTIKKEKDARRYISKLLTEADQWEDQLHEMNPLTRTKKKEDTTLWELWDVYRTLKLPKTCPNNQKLMNRAIRYCEEYYDIPWTKMEVVDFQRIIDKVTNTYDCRRKVKNLLSGLNLIVRYNGLTCSICPKRQKMVMEQDPSTP